MRKLLVCLTAAGLLALAAPAAAAPAASPSASPSPAVPPAPPVPPGTPDPLAQQVQQALQDQAAIQAAKSALGGDVQAAKDQQGSLQTLIVTEQQTITATLARVADAEQRYHDATAREQAEHAIASDARDHERLDKQLLALSMKQRYTQQDGLVSFLLGSSDFSDLMARAASVSNVINRSSDLVSQVKQDVATAEAAEHAARVDADTAAAEAADLVAQQGQLQEQVGHQNDLIGQLGSQARAASREIQLADGQDLALVQKIAQLRIQQLDQTIADAEAADWQAAQFYLQHHLGDVPTGMPGADQPAPPGGPARFVWPVPGSVFSQPFGPSPYDFEPPYLGFPHFHTGIDLAAPLGTPVYAAAAGVVVSATTSNVGYGDHIILAHDTAVLTLYGHLESMGVKPGDTVQQGQLIGLMGSTGNSTGSHTHFELRVNNQPTDPAPFLPPLPKGAAGPPPLPRH